MSWLGFEHPTFRLRGERSNPLRHRPPSPPPWPSDMNTCTYPLSHTLYHTSFITSLFHTILVHLSIFRANYSVGCRRHKQWNNEIQDSWKWKKGGGEEIWKLGWYSYHLIFIICQQRPIQLVEKLKWFFASTEKYDYDIICNSAMFKVWNNPALNNVKINVFFVEMHWTLNNNNKSRYHPRKELKTLVKMRYAHWCSFPTFLANLRRYM